MGSSTRGQLRKFVNLVRKIVEYAREMAGTKLEVYRPPLSGRLTGDELQIREQANVGVDVLRSELKEQRVIASARSGATCVEDDLADLADVHEDAGAKKESAEEKDGPDDDEDVADYTNCSEKF